MIESWLALSTVRTHDSQGRPIISKLCKKKFVERSARRNAKVQPKTKSKYNLGPADK